MTAADEDIRIAELWHKGMKPAQIARTLRIPLDVVYRRLKVLERRLAGAQGVVL